MFRPKIKVFVSPLPDWPIESGPHNFFFLWLKMIFLFCFLPKFINLYFAVSRSFLFYFIILKFSILKLQKFSWFWYIYLYHILELIFPLSEIKKMFHQPSDPSLLDTVIYGLVKGNKNNFNVGLIIWQSYELLHDKNNKMTCAPSKDCALNG